MLPVEVSAEAMCWDSILELVQIDSEAHVFVQIP